MESLVDSREEWNIERERQGRDGRRQREFEQRETAIADRFLKSSCRVFGRLPYGSGQGR